MFTVLFIITINAFDVIKSSIQCCEINGPQTDPDVVADLRKCFDGVPKTDTENCDIDMCVAERKGYMAPGKRINKAALDEEMTHDFGHIPTLLKLVKENCVYGNLSKFGSACEFILTRRCIHLHMIAFCPSWKHHGNCEYEEQKAVKCVEEMEKYSQADMETFWGK